MTTPTPEEQLQSLQTTITVDDFELGKACDRTDEACESCQ